MPPEFHWTTSPRLCFLQNEDFKLFFNSVVFFTTGRNCFSISDLFTDSSFVAKTALRSYYPELASPSRDLYQGDILATPDLVVTQDGRNAVISTKYKWPNATVPYQFTSNYTEEEREKVESSMKEIETKTCVKFTPKADIDKDYILINKISNRGCFALAGYRPEIRPMPVNFMPPDCFKHAGTIQHELLHVLGLLHEQARPDRDQHVKVLWQNIDDKHKSDFGKAPPSMVTTYDVPYDMFSVMHYPNMAFSKNGKPTLISRQFAGDERYPELSSRLFQGDILLDSRDDAKNAVVSPKLKWPNGIVHYEFTSNYTEEERTKVRKNMDLLESKTCVKFVQHKNEEVYILINKRPYVGCYAILGYRTEIGPIPVNYMSPQCLSYAGTIQHELLHVLGLMHEQARTDRDAYVDVLWDNIEEAHYNDFSRAYPGSATAFGLPYNIMSVMHYPNIAFSKNGKPTILYKKDPSTEMGQRVGVTEGDLEKVRRMYNCPEQMSNGTSGNSPGVNPSNFFNILNIFKPS
ncbi:astacin-like metalloendopeptidase [Nilaparvata lugens]|uniref:astacin-like metalloendopeptidase n=1 Tax=Nilaparvata lugens TaxID=108931 RepID=UPI00193DCDB4|nr:astacin-like metalloendopeptidase [Nilaparvata lugens]